MSADAVQPVDPESEALAWERELSRELGCPVKVVWSRARRRVIATRAPAARGLFRRPAPAIELRLAGFFARAPSAVREATASWLRSGRRARRACRILDEWIESQVAELPPGPLRRGRVEPRGRCHDLEALRLDLLAHEFADGSLPLARAPAITWGRSAGRRARRALRLGSCDVPRGLIRIHPVLDQPAVPRFFVRFIAFHELLHAALPPVRKGSGGRTRNEFHGPEFRRRESAHPDCARALAWQARHIEALIRSARTGRPMPGGGAVEAGARATGWLPFGP